MKKGLTLPSVAFDYSDLSKPELQKLDLIFIGGAGLEETKERVKKVRAETSAEIILDIGWGTYDQDTWKKMIEEIDAPYYYMDEPYAARPNWYMKNRGESKELAEQHAYWDIIFRRDYLKLWRPNSKFVIGDIREPISKDYVPIPGVWYTYTSYTNNVYIPIWGKALPFGLGNQSPALRRLHKKVGGKISFVWIFGKNKLLCHPDEYHKVFKTCKELGIPAAVLYANSDPGKYKLNTVTKEEEIKYLNHFLNEEKPYTIFEWWGRLLHRLKLSFKELWETKSFKLFFEHLF